MVWNDFTYSWNWPATVCVSTMTSLSLMSPHLSERFTAWQDSFHCESLQQQKTASDGTWDYEENNLEVQKKKMEEQALDRIIYLKG